MRAIVIALAMLLLAAPASAATAALLLEHDSPSAWTDLLRKGAAGADVIIAPPGPRQADILREAASSHDLVIVASDNLHELARDNAANFRRVKFGVIDAGIRASNIMSITFADEQAAFLAGAAAAMLAAPKEPVIGWLSGCDTPAMRSLFNGYAEGAQLARPGARIIQAVAGSFTDGEAAAKKAQWLIDSGAKIIALAAGAGNKAAFAVCQRSGAPVIELDAPSGAAAVGVIAKAADKAARTLIQAAENGDWRGKEILTYNLANGGVDFAGLDAYIKKTGAGQDAARRVKELRSELEKGGIRLHSLRQRALCDCLD